ncbi:hypothetical protein VUJ46_21345 [Chryseobacterium sp. MYb264]|uniref:helix-turn-helix transcriptional regulator n=1 Tax=Chryseobacterium sp. MYb264 TaxID=2745153 RepID=UPI002E112C06|nr:hypothetical protein VUJ46_21345 [Chryseobacterium sp. MYb264]
MYRYRLLKSAFLWIVVSLISGAAFGQTTYRKQIDSINKIIDKSYVYGISNPDLFLKNASMLYYLSYEAKDSKGMISALFEEAKMYITMGEWDMALTKVNQGITLADQENDYNMLTRFFLLHQKLLLDLDHLNASKMVLAKAEEYNELVESLDDRRINHVFILLAQADLIVIKDDHADQNQIIKIKKNALQEARRVSSVNIYKNTAEVCALGSLSWSLSFLKDLSAAKKYTGMMDKKTMQYQSEALTVLNLMTKGKIQNAEQNYPQAIEYLTKALKDSGREKNFITLLKIYPMISESYVGMKDYENSTLYATKYKNLIDSVDILKKRSGDINFLNKINYKIFTLETRKRKAVRYYLPIGLMVILTMLGLLYYRKRMIIKRNEDSIKNTEKTTLEKQSETTKVLVQLAKEDIKTFHVEFQKVYPTFYKILKERYPDLNISDLNFCSLIKMSFSIKEISQYTRCTIRAAEARRYRINKKLDINNQNDLYYIISLIN